MTRLDQSTVDGLDVPGPDYAREGVETGVVHIGVGAFHRAHLAMFHDRLLDAGEGSGWALCGAGVLESDAAIRDVLRAQDGLYTLVLKHADGTDEPRVIGSIVDYVDAAEDPEPLLERIADPATRIVSLTITEGGYTEANPTFDLLVVGLGRRRARGAGAVTVMSCDNLEHNGVRAREVTLARARAAGPDVAGWIEAHVAFPSSMVDRITPRTTDADRAELAARFGVEDRWPVVCEPFVQWVVEDAFAAGRPPYETVGVQVVADVEPYELMKLRLLNASHQALGHFGRLLGHGHVHDAARDPALRDVVAAYMRDEATPTLPAVGGVDLAAYRDTLLERFANPRVRDTTARLCADASNRIPPWLVPVIARNLDGAGGGVRISAAIVAAWAHRMATDDDVDDPRADRLRALAHDDDPLAFVRDELFGAIGAVERFTGAYLDALRRLRDGGPAAALGALR